MPTIHPGLPGLKTLEDDDKVLLETHKANVLRGHRLRQLYQCVPAMALSPHILGLLLK